MAFFWGTFGGRELCFLFGGNKQGLLVLVVLSLVASSSLAFCDGAFLAKASFLKGKQACPDLVSGAFVCSSFVPAIRSVIPMPIPWLPSVQPKGNYFQKLKQCNKLG
jgi:hypothetical protein